MWMIVFSCMLVIVLGAFALILSYYRKAPLSWFFSVVVAVMFVFLIFSAAPKTLGYGRVPMEITDYAKWFDEGKVYQVLSSVEEGASQVLLVKEDHGMIRSKLYAIRVEKKSIPPQRFVLLDGKPFEIK